MNSYRTPLLVGAFALCLLVLAGCECATRGDCAPPPPVPVAKPLPPPPPCDPCAQPVAVAAPAPVGPRYGVCWVDSLDQPIRMADPPSVTYNRNGDVVATAPAGRVQPPRVAPVEPELAFAYRR